jgi:hypothetical protein
MLRRKLPRADLVPSISDGSFVRIADIHFFSREGLLAYQESNSSALFALIGLFKQSYNTHLRL